ncbi:MAG: hypothetical protein QOF92_52 [Pseudonocardiales bacterium]|jgi:hypothetical protein|nr:hypothetical protein [Pseudonocardiales bacterium]
MARPLPLFKIGRRSGGHRAVKPDWSRNLRSAPISPRSWFGVRGAAPASADGRDSAPDRVELGDRVVWQFERGDGKVLA